jgi:O-acetyl-ADP-ribose deacetylase (regulator of RNase III)
MNNPKQAPFLLLSANINGISFELWEGNIFDISADIIVNAANEDLSHGSGVAGMIREKAGEGLVQESQQWINMNGRVPDGGVACTNSYKMTQFKMVIHAVGPRGPDSDYKNNHMMSTIQNSLLKANEFQAESIVFPTLSVGIFNYPKEIAALIHINTMINYCSTIAPNYQRNLKTIIICLYDKDVMNIFTSTAINQLQTFNINFIYYGFREEYRVCQNCRLPAKAICYQVWKCCSMVCDFCFYYNPTQACLSCNNPLYMPENYPSPYEAKPCRVCTTFINRSISHSC